MCASWTLCEQMIVHISENGLDGIVCNPDSINRNWQVISETELSCNVPFTRSLTEWCRRQQASKVTPCSMTIRALRITARTSL